MNGVTIMIISLAVLLLAYILYGRWIAKKWGVDPKEKNCCIRMGSCFSAFLLFRLCVVVDDSRKLFKKGDSEAEETVTV